MNKLQKSSDKKNVVRNIVLVILFFALLPVLVAGYTHALVYIPQGGWFTSTTELENVFTTGTLDLLVTNLNETQTGSWEIGECLENQYTITNSGSKNMYVRASFEGFWKRLYHRNTATVTALYKGQTVTDSDQAHYSFGNYSPSYNSNFSPEASYGFFDDSSPMPTLFPFLWSASEALSSNGDSSSLNSSNVNALSGYPEVCNGPLVPPITGEALSLQYPNLFDNPNALNDPDVSNVKQYLGPQSCDQFYSFKIDADQNGIPNGATYTDRATGFTVTIYKKLISGNYYFAYQTNYPIYHLYAKGGNQGGNFYLYYPTYIDGVYQDCGLSQPEGNWSHITFYYCVPPANPSIEIVKQVSVNGGLNWFDADEAYGPELIGYQPKFRFWVTNTGNVTLENIVVKDNVFGHIGIISTLVAGASDGFIINDNFWDTVLDSGNVKITLCDSNHNGYVRSDWTKKGDFFYYLKPIKSGQSITLCIKACLIGPTGALYDGAQFTLYSNFEAVQTTNGLVHVNWNGNPY